MFANILFWIVISFIAFPFGIIIADILKVNIKNSSYFLLTILGILPITILVTIGGIFYRVNIEFLVLIVVIAITAYLIKKDIVRDKFTELKIRWQEFSPMWQFSVIAFILITALQSSMPTNIPDDGFYYLQTVKWANEVGIPKGVARFGFQYGQFSSWHVTQAVFNLSYFFGNQFNILSGWIMTIFILWTMFNLKSAKKSEKFFYLFIVFNSVVLQFFVTAPSPDLPVILLSLIIFKIFLFDDNSGSNFRIIVLLTLLAISIKTSSFYLIFFVLAFGYKKVLKERKLIILSFIICILIINKNVITTGTLLYPLDFYSPAWIDWKVDEKILEEGKTIIKNSPITGNYSDLLNDYSLKQKIELWFNFKGYRGVTNKLWLFGIFTLGIVSLINKSRRFFLVFIISIFLFLVLWTFSPNYRFALAVIVLDYFLILYFLQSVVVSYSKILLPVGLISSIIWLTPLINPILSLSANPVISKSYPFKPEYFLMSSKPFMSESYEKNFFNGEVVYIPPNYHYAWDGPLPCVMRSHFEKYEIKK